MLAAATDKWVNVHPQPPDDPSPPQPLGQRCVDEVVNNEAIIGVPPWTQCDSHTHADTEVVVAVVVTGIAAVNRNLSVIGRAEWTAAHKGRA